MIQIAVITACYSLTPLFIAISAGRLIDRVGEKIPIVMGSLGISLALALPYLYPVLPMLYVSQLLLGGSQLVAVIAIQNGVGGSVPFDMRSRAIGMISLSVSVGLMLGPLVGGYATEHLGFRDSYLLYSLFPVVSLLLAVLLPVRPIDKKIQDHPITGTGELLSIPGLKRCIFVSMINLASLDLFYVYYPLFANSVGLSPSQIGWILMIQSLSSVIARIFLPTVVLKFGTIRVLSLFMFCGAIAYGAIPFFRYIIFIAFVAMMLGAGLGMAQPLTTITTYNLAPPGRTAEVLGVRMTGNRFSQVVIPLFFGSISNYIGLGVIFSIEAFVLGVAAVMSRKIETEANHADAELSG